MSLPIAWKRQAIADLARIGCKIALESPVSAERMVSLIESKVLLLAEHPNLGKSSRKRGVRELIAHEQYLVVYRAAPDQVEVLCVKHSEQPWPCAAA